MKSQEIEESEKKVSPPRDIRDCIGLNWMNRENQGRQRGGCEAFSEPADQCKDQQHIGGVNDEVGQMESKSPFTPERVVYGVRDISNRTIRIQKEAKVYLMYSLIGEHQEEVVKYKLISQAVRITDEDDYHQRDDRDELGVGREKRNETGL